MSFPLIKPTSLLAAGALAAIGTAASTAAPSGPAAPERAQASTSSDITTSRTRIARAAELAATRVSRTPYRWGGTSLTYGADCSGFTKAVYAKQGVSLPRTASQQRSAVRAISKRWLRPGDLVFFGSSAYHMGIYAGNGYIIDAPSSGRYVSKRKIWTSDVRYGTLRPAV